MRSLPLPGGANCLFGAQTCVHTEKVAGARTIAPRDGKFWCVTHTALSHSGPVTGGDIVHRTQLRASFRVLTELLLKIDVSWDDTECTLV